MLRRHGLPSMFVVPLSVLCGLPVLFGTDAMAAEPPPGAPAASDSTRAAQAVVRASLPLDDPRDFENARRGFIATLDDGVIRDAAGNVVFDTSAYAFLDGSAPDTVNPSLWRQSQLNRIHGLFEVVDGIWQVRGLDISNLSIVRGEKGWIVIDPLTSVETAAAALALVNAKLGARPVSAVIYTHSHADHYAGVAAVASAADVRAGNVQVIAPEGFMQAAIAENVLAGPHMARRAGYMFGGLLPKSAVGTVGSGLGQTTARGSTSLLPPTHVVRGAHERLVIDGVEFLFLNAPESEAPAEMMFYLPAWKAFCQAEDINHTMHNLYTPRGAKVRDGLAWSRYIHDAIETWGGDVAVSFGSHHWPTWGNAEVVTLWKQQRDLYRYIHDQTLRLANQGHTMLEIAEMLELPPSLARTFANRGYYGTVSHNAKAQYQLYFGWFDGNPANLHALPPAAAGTKYVEALGGADAVLKLGREAADRGDDRWAAMLLNHLVFAEPGNASARTALASVYEQLGYRAESGPWRNFYLSGALELRNPRPADAGLRPGSPAVLRALPLGMLLDAMAVRVDGPRADGRTQTINLDLRDVDARAVLYLEHGVLNHTLDRAAAAPDASVSLTREVLEALIVGATTVEAAEQAGALIGGERAAFVELIALLEQPQSAFPIVTP